MRHIRRAAAAVLLSTAIAACSDEPTAADPADPAADEPTETVDYVALGDSYAAGLGAGDYLDDACGRSAAAYPNLLAADGDGAFDFAACSGATTADLLSDQIEYLDEHTDLVTVAIGGNDIGWGTAIAACMQPVADICAVAVEVATAAIDDDLPALLDTAYTAIGEAAPNARVIVLGYPRLFAETEPCQAIAGVAVDQQALMNAAADRLADVTADVTAEYDFTYVDVRDRFDGHAICAEDEWVSGFTGDAASFHPTAPGHADGYLPAVLEVL